MTARLTCARLNYKEILKYTSEFVKLTFEQNLFRGILVTVTRPLSPKASFLVLTSKFLVRKDSSLSLGTCIFISDCTGGHKMMQFDTASQNNRDKE